MNEIIKALEDQLRQTHEGVESLYELGYEDAIKYALNLIKTQQDAQISNNRG